MTLSTAARIFSFPHQLRLASGYLSGPRETAAAAIKSAIASTAVVGNLELGQSAHLHYRAQGYGESECRKDDNLCHNILLSLFGGDPPR